MEQNIGVSVCVCVSECHPFVEENFCMCAKINIPGSVIIYNGELLLSGRKMCKWKMERKK